ncbi:MAG: DUF3050 domain-containing protein [Sphingobacteriaceae bacterium]|nr:DUF3050 domain-containing protein [Sphingobacteriaceae bacterium]
MKERLEKIQEAIAPLQQQIVNHKVYGAIHTLADLRVFMEHHVFAVWDFMSLLKALQNNLTCTQVPWFPVGTADTRYLINEIVTGEESDVDAFGVRKSHFELYLEAMQQCGANTKPIEIFVEELKKGNNFAQAYQQSNTPQAARDFVDFTFHTIDSQKNHLQSAVFTFGREDLIPSMFFSIVNDIHQNFPDQVSIFKYYLERHIEVDGDHHSNLALEMTAKLCGDDEHLWKEAEQASLLSLQKRIDLWDGAYAALQAKK